MMTIHMMPPPHEAPYKRFTLSSTGREVRPNFAKDGLVVAETEAEAAELEAEGWTRQSIKADSDNLQRAAEIAASRHQRRN